MTRAIESCANGVIRTDIGVDAVDGVDTVSLGVTSGCDATAGDETWSFCSFMYNSLNVKYCYLLRMGAFVLPAIARSSVECFIDNSIGQLIKLPINMGECHPLKFRHQSANMFVNRP